MAIIRKQDNIRFPIRAATTTNITLSGTQTIDGVVLTNGDRVLVKDQNNKTQNGIYVVKSTDWERASDYDNNSELLIGSLIFVVDGLINKESFWMLSTFGNGPTVVGTTEINFKKATGDNNMISYIGTSEPINPPSNMIWIDTN